MRESEMPVKTEAHTILEREMRDRLKPRQKERVRCRVQTEAKKKRVRCRLKPKHSKKIGVRGNFGERSVQTEA